MSVVPKKKIDMIEFYENHVGPWTTNAVAIGTSASAVTDLDTKTDTARAKWVARQAAQASAEAATIELNVAVEVMATAGAAIIKQVRAKAEMSGDGVYALAQIPVPATPSPVGAPGTPSNFKVQLRQDGTLDLRWKCANPAGCDGTMYQVYRRVGSAGEFTYLGGSGEKEFTDATVPAGASAITYKIQGVRSTAVGEWGEFNVNFGTGSGGAATATISEAGPKMAA